MFDKIKKLFRKRTTNEQHLKDFLEGYEKWKGEQMDQQIKERIENIQTAIEVLTMTHLKTNIDTQVILQIMVAKGICTTEEVWDMRKIVQANTEAGKLLTELENESKSVYEEYKESLMVRKLIDPDSLSEEEQDFLAKELQEEYKRKDAKEVEDTLYKISKGEEVSDEERYKVANTLDNLIKSLEGEGNE